MGPILSIASRIPSKSLGGMVRPYGHHVVFPHWVALILVGQTRESTVLDELLVGADACLVDEDGDRIGWPFAIGCDKGYRADWIDQYLLELGIEPVIPSKENEDRAARPVEFNRQAYRRRNIVEGLIGWLKECRRIFLRFEKTAKNFSGMLTLAFIKQYLTYELV